MRTTAKNIGYTPQSAVNRLIKDGSRFDKYFPPSQNKKELLKRDGEVEDTIEFIKDILNEYNYQCKDIAQVLAVRNNGKIDEYATCKRIWHFVVDYIKYNIEKGEQLRTPSQTWYDAQIMHRTQPSETHSADCDCMSIFVGSILMNLGIPFSYRITGYSDVLGICHGWQHIYTIAHTTKGDVIIDPVYHKFDAEKKYDIHKDVRITVMNGLNGCDIYRLSGIDVYEEGEFGDLSGRKSRREKRAKRRAARKEKRAARKAMRRAKKSGDKEAYRAAKERKKEAKKIIKENRTGIAKAMQKVGKGIANFVKKSTMLVPRSMFNLLLRLNFRGMATKFANNPEAYSKFLKIWKKVFGGKEKKLRKAIEKGKNRKALFGKGKGVKGINGLYNDYDAVAGYLCGLPVFDKIRAKFRRLFQRDRQLNGSDCISSKFGDIDGLGFAATAAVSSAIASATPIIKKAIAVFNKVKDAIPENVQDAIKQKMGVQQVDEDEAINYESENYEDEDDESESDSNESDYDSDDE